MSNDGIVCPTCGGAGRLYTRADLDAAVKGATSVNPVKVSERGWPGHFICADRCLYRRNTLIEYGDKRIIVSTVGDMRGQDGKLSTIGHERYYETAAFWAALNDGYWDADTSRRVDFDAEWGVRAEAVSALPDDVDEVANLMHEKVVSELSEKLLRGLLAEAPDDTHTDRPLQSRIQRRGAGAGRSCPPPPGDAC
jgi:hypothetical protein